MRELPARIKEITNLAISKFRVHSNIFFFCWLLSVTIMILFRDGRLNVSEELQAFMWFIWLFLVIASIIFLIFTLRVLYKPNYFWGNLIAYIIAGFIPFGGIISLAVALTVFIDSRKVIKVYSITKLE